MFKFDLVYDFNQEITSGVLKGPNVYIFKIGDHYRDGLVIRNPVLQYGE